MGLFVQAIVLAGLSSAILASSDGLDVASAELQRDDECVAGEGESCDISLAQLRARQASAPARTVAAEAGAAAEAAEGAAAGKDAAAGASMDGTLQRKGQVQNHGPSNIMTLYHQTSSSAGRNILASGFWMSKPYAICGQAIYFSPSAHDTDDKAMGGRGFMIEATVDMGKIKTMGKQCDHSMTEAKLHAMGYDSITLDRGGYAECKHLASCREYVIYSNSRILHMKGYNYQGSTPWWWKSLSQEGANVTANASKSDDPVDRADVNSTGGPAV